MDNPHGDMHIFTFLYYMEYTDGSCPSFINPYRWAAMCTQYKLYKHELEDIVACQVKKSKTKRPTR